MTNTAEDTAGGTAARPARRTTSSRASVMEGRRAGTTPDPTAGRPTAAGRR